MPNIDPTACSCTPDHVPVACDLTVFTPTERQAHLEKGRRLLEAAVGCREDADGFRLTLVGISEEQVARWAHDERRCCPFFVFWTVRGSGDALVLGISGPAAAKEIMRPELERRALLTPATADPEGANPAAPAPPTAARPR